MEIDWRERAGEISAVPNLVSLSRLPLVALVILFLESPVRYPLFGLVVLTDALDGWLARRLEQETELGALLDPVLDKLTALVLVLALFPRTGLATEYLLLFFARDAFVVALAVVSPLLTFEPSDVKARTLGKGVTALQSTAIVAMLVPHVSATQLLLWVLGTVSALAIADYAVFVGRELTDWRLFESREAATGIYLVTTLAFAAVVWALLSEELLEALALLR